jgi:hypothetical protein
MSSHLPEKTKKLETNIINYLKFSYYHGYDLDLFFTEEQKITMFERLLNCDVSFNQEWKSGVYSIPENPKETMRLSSYIKKQSATKKLSRKISNYISNNKLTEGAKNLLKAYMIKQSQEYMEEGKDRNIDSRMEKMFCGIFKQISERKRTDLSKKVPEDVAKGIFTFGGTKRKKFIKTKRKTYKREGSYKGVSEAESVGSL